MTNNTKSQLSGLWKYGLSILKCKLFFLLLAQRGSRAYDVLRTRLVGGVHNDICDLHMGRSRSLLVVAKTTGEEYVQRRISKCLSLVQ